jgi:hypothetical protein
MGVDKAPSEAYTDADNRIARMPNPRVAPGGGGPTRAFS